MFDIGHLACSLLNNWCTIPDSTQPNPGSKMARTHDAILIVDDASDVLKILQADLEESGFRADATLSGEEALRLIEAKPPDLLLIDLLMSRMDGYEMARRRSQ